MNAFRPGSALLAVARPRWLLPWRSAAGRARHLPRHSLARGLLAGVLCAATLPLNAQVERDAARFDGSAVLSSQSDRGQRFALHAELQRTLAPSIDSAQRFALDARLAAQRSMTTACIQTEDIFQNGFE